MCLPEGYHHTYGISGYCLQSSQQCRTSCNAAQGKQKLMIKITTVEDAKYLLKGPTKWPESHLNYVLQTEQARVTRLVKTILESETDKKIVYTLRGDDARKVLDILETVNFPKIHEYAGSLISLNIRSLITRLRKVLAGQHRVC